DSAAVRREGDTENNATVPLEVADFLPRGRVPQADHLVGAARQRLTAVRGESDIEERGIVAGELTHLLAGPQVPDAGRPALAGGLGATAIGRKGDTLQGAGDPDGLQLLAAVQVIQPGRVLASTAQHLLAIR